MFRFNSLYFLPLDVWAKLRARCFSFLSNLFSWLWSRALELIFITPAAAGCSNLSIVETFSDIFLNKTCSQSLDYWDQTDLLRLLSLFYPLFITSYSRLLWRPSLGGGAGLWFLMLEDMRLIRGVKVERRIIGFNYSSLILHPIKCEIMFSLKFSTAFKN